MHWRLQGKKIFFLYDKKKKKSTVKLSSFESKFQKEKEVGLVRKRSNKYLIIDLRYRHNEIQIVWKFEVLVVVRFLGFGGLAVWVFF